MRDSLQNSTNDRVKYERKDTLGDWSTYWVLIKINETTSSICMSVKKHIGIISSYTWVSNSHLIWIKYNN